MILNWLKPEIKKMIREKVVQAKYEMHTEVASATNPRFRDLEERIKSR
tara:strand:+ start:944 stop:1087 length:144 start_codon:yes stop_codon:yes gene_type:complete